MAELYEDAIAGAELEEFFANLIAENPELPALIRHERERMDRSYQRDCPWGRCEISIDPVNNEILSAIGLLGCGCDYFPGWRSKYYDGLPKPGWNAKPVGRHGGRIARSRRKTKRHEAWLAECFPQKETDEAQDRG